MSSYLAAAASEDPRILPRTQEAALTCFQQCTEVASRSYTDISVANEETYRNRLAVLELAIARILKPFWDTPIFRRQQTRGDPSRFECTFKLSRPLPDYVHAASALRTVRRLISSSSAFYYLFCNPRDLQTLGVDFSEARVGLSAIERLRELDHYLNYVGQVFALLLTFADHPPDQMRAQVELEDAQQLEQQSSAAAILFRRLYHLLNFGISSIHSTTAGSLAGRLHTATLQHILSTDRQVLD